MPLSQKSINFGGLWIKVDSFALDVLACRALHVHVFGHGQYISLVVVVVVVGVFFPSLCSPWPNVQPAGRP